jgi:hypothetical protein
MLLLPLFLTSTGVAGAQELPGRYGDRGSSHVGFVVGLGGGGGGFRYLAGAEYGYFVWDGVAPGLEAQVSGGDDVLTTGLTMGTLRLVPLRTGWASLFVVGRGGRVFLSDHEDLWGAGGSAGVILFNGPRFGISVAYEYLRLFPADACDDLTDDCAIHGPSIGVAVGF